MVFDCTSFERDEEHADAGIVREGFENFGALRLAQRAVKPHELVASPRQGNLQKKTNEQKMNQDNLDIDISPIDSIFMPVVIACQEILMKDFKEIRQQHERLLCIMGF
jgi:hypothetical protein